MVLLFRFVNRYEMVSSSNHEGRQTVSNCYCNELYFVMQQQRFCNRLHFGEYCRFADLNCPYLSDTIPVCRISGDIITNVDASVDACNAVRVKYSSDQTTSVPIRVVYGRYFKKILLIKKKINNCPKLSYLKNLIIF